MNRPSIHCHRFARVLARLLILALSGGIVGVAAARDLDIAVVDSHGKPLPNAAVMATWAGAPSSPAKPPPAEMIQRHIQFIPHMLVLPVGTNVLFPNEDRTRHHVYSFSKAKTFNLKLYIGRPEQPVDFDKPGVVTLGCNIHDQMQAFIVVTKDPRWAKTDDSGHATLARLPAKPISLSIWQPLMVSESARATQTVAADATHARIQLDVTSPAAAADAGAAPTLQQQFDSLAH